MHKSKQNHSFINDLIVVNYNQFIIKAFNFHKKLNEKTEYMYTNIQYIFGKAVFKKSFCYAFKERNAQKEQIHN